MPDTKYHIINGGINICNEEILVCHTSKRENVFFWKETCHSSVRERKWKNGMRMIWEHLWWIKNLNQVLRIISSFFPFSWVEKIRSMIFLQDVFVPLIKIFSLSRNWIDKGIIDILRQVLSLNTMLFAWTFLSFNFQVSTFCHLDKLTSTILHISKPLYKCVVYYFLDLKGNLPIPNIKLSEFFL